MKMQVHGGGALGWIVVGFLLFSQSAWGAHYRLVSLAQEGETKSRATAVDGGRVTGVGYFPGRLLPTGYVWSSGQFTPLTPLATHAEEGAGASFFRAWGINASGQVAGESGFEKGTRKDCKAVFAGQDAVTHLLPEETETESRALGINASGVICGQFGTTAALWNDGAQALVSIEGGTESTAWGINDQGDVVGAAQVGEETLAFARRGGTTSLLPGLIGGTESCARSINIHGEIAGTMLLNGYRTVGVLWHDGAAEELPSLGMMAGSQALCINGFGDAVGQADIPKSGYPPKTTAVLWKKEGGVIRLDQVVASSSMQGWTLDCATAIDDEGWVVGYGTFDNRETGFLLKPEVSQSVRGSISTRIPGYELPLQGVTAQLEETDFTCTSGADGRFVLHGLPTGTFVLRLSADGLMPLRIPVTLAVAEDFVVPGGAGVMQAATAKVGDAACYLDMTDAHAALSGATGL